MKIDQSKIRRLGNTIILSPGLTATEGMEGNLPSLSIRKDGELFKFYRGSSLRFGDELSDEDREYLASLAERED